MSETRDVFSLTLQNALRHAMAHLDNLDTAPVAATVDFHTLRNQLSRPLSDDGVAPEQVIDELAAGVAGGIIGSAGGRFYGWVIGGALPAALAADWLTSTWDQNAPLYATSPAAAIAEEVAGEWLLELLALPAGASFALVTGAQMAHITGLAAARNALLSRRGWDVEDRGLYGAPPIRILTGQRHSTLDRALRMLGMGLAHIIELETGDDGCLLPASLERELDARRNQTTNDQPTIVHLQAGDINTGSFDPFEALIPIAHHHKAWVHVDGAFGLWAAASPRFRHLTRGVEVADSWVTDGHKWLNVPFDCGIAFVADPEAHRASLAQRAAYISHHEDARDAMNYTPEWSRRARGFSTYAAIRQLGRHGVAELVERCCDHARAITEGIGALPGAEVLALPTLNQGMVHFPGRNADEVIAAINATGEAFFTGTTWRGNRAMRISVCNWRTTARDVERAIRAAAVALGH